MVGLISFCRSLLDKFIKNLRILGSSLFWSLKNTHFFKIFFIFLYTHLVCNVEILAYFTFLDFWKFEAFFAIWWIFCIFFLQNYFVTWIDWTFYLSLNIHIILFTYTAVDEQWQIQRILDAGILVWVPELCLNSWKTVKKKCHLFKSHRIKSSLQLYLNILRHLFLLNLWFSTTKKTNQNSFNVLF